MNRGKIDRYIDSFENISVNRYFASPSKQLGEGIILENKVLEKEEKGFFFFFFFFWGGGGGGGWGVKGV